MVLQIICSQAALPGHGKWVMGRDGAASAIIATTTQPFHAGAWSPAVLLNVVSAASHGTCGLPCMQGMQRAVLIVRQSRGWSLALAALHTSHIKQGRATGLPRMSATGLVTYMQTTSDGAVEAVAQQSQTQHNLLQPAELPVTPATSCMVCMVTAYYCLCAHTCMQRMFDEDTSSNPRCLPQALLAALSHDVALHVR